MHQKTPKAQNDTSLSFVMMIEHTHKQAHFAMMRQKTETGKAQNAKKLKCFACFCLESSS
jgi:hypothetical protein